jgi:glycosyltransferase involved in cell wall biosynthesis
MKDKLRINFVMPPVASISGGPLAILEYANRFIERGHTVTVTTFPDSMWAGDNPFPWFKFNGRYLYKKTRVAPVEKTPASRDSLELIASKDYSTFRQIVLGNFGLEGILDLFLNSTSHLQQRRPFEFFTREILTWIHTMEVMPDCDLNIATLWTTTFPVYFSGKGKPVFFMQHFEEVFYSMHPSFAMHRLGAKIAYSLPLYKVANSSWLQNIMVERFGQKVPFSNNGIEISDFSPMPKKSAEDGVIRVITYARPEEWKGFADAVAAMAQIRERYGNRVEWRVFGYRHPHLTEMNGYAPYTYHPKLSFKQLAELYATSDIALCPSWYESFPLPPLEGMASGTAVVTTAYGVEDYAFHDQNALVVGPRRVDEMVNAISRLVEDEPLRERLAEAGRKTAESLHWDRAVEEREQILQQIHSGEPGYDIFKSIKLGLKDGNGVEFESAPADIPTAECGLFWYDNHLFVLHNGTRRHVESPDVIPLLLKHNLKYIEMDSLAVERTPLGPSVSTPADIPVEWPA